MITCSTCSTAGPKDNGVTIPAWITDGLSNTLLFAEQAGRPDFYILGKKQASNSAMTNPQFWGCWASYQSVTAQGAAANGTTAGGVYAINGQNGQGINSFHVNGTNISLCDGSVRFINANIPLAVLLSMTTRDGGEATDGSY